MASNRGSKFARSFEFFCACPATPTTPRSVLQAKSSTPDWSKLERRAFFPESIAKSNTRPLLGNGSKGLWEPRYRVRGPGFSRLWLLSHIRRSEVDNRLKPGLHTLWILRLSVRPTP